MYFVWRSDTGLADTFMHVGKRPEGFKPAKWKTGRAFVKNPPVMTLVGDDESPMVLSDVILTGFNVPILSPKAVSVLEGVGVHNLQYFPVIIKNSQTGELDKSYKIINVVGLVFCLDRENSVFKTFPEDDDISWLERYSIFEDKVVSTSSSNDAPLLFRLGEFRYHVLVHEYIQDAFEKDGITGSEFIPPKDFV